MKIQVRVWPVLVLFMSGIRGQLDLQNHIWDSVTSEGQFEDAEAQRLGFADRMCVKDIFLPGLGDRKDKFSRQTVEIREWNLRRDCYACE